MEKSQRTDQSASRSSLSSKVKEQVDARFKGRPVTYSYEGNCSGRIEFQHLISGIFDRLEAAGMSKSSQLDSIIQSNASPQTKITKLVKFSKASSNKDIAAHALLLAMELDSNSSIKDSNVKKAVMKLAQNLLETRGDSDKNLIGAILIDQLIEKDYPISKSESKYLQKLLNQLAPNISSSNIHDFEKKEIEEVIRLITSNLELDTAKITTDTKPDTDTLKERLVYSKAAHALYGYETVEGNPWVSEVQTPESGETSVNLDEKLQSVLAGMTPPIKDYKIDQKTGAVITKKGVVLKLSYNQEKDEIAISFGGTSAGAKSIFAPRSKTWRKQWSVNLRQRSGMVTGADREVMRISKALVESLEQDPQFNDKTIVFTGHSKGGKGAMTAALITGKDAYVDNPEPIQAGLRAEIEKERSNKGRPLAAVAKDCIYVTKTDKDYLVSGSASKNYDLFTNTVEVKVGGMDLMHYHARTDIVIESNIPKAKTRDIPALLNDINQLKGSLTNPNLRAISQEEQDKETGTVAILLKALNTNSIPTNEKIEILNVLSKIENHSSKTKELIAKFCKNHKNDKNQKLQNAMRNILLDMCKIMNIDDSIGSLQAALVLIEDFDSLQQLSEKARGTDINTNATDALAGIVSIYLENDGSDSKIQTSYKKRLKKHKATFTKANNKGSQKATQTPPARKAPSPQQPERQPNNPSIQEPEDRRKSNYNYY